MIDPKTLHIAVQVILGAYNIPKLYMFIIIGGTIDASIEHIADTNNPIESLHNYSSVT